MDDDSPVVRSSMISDYVEGVLAGERRVVAKAITLLESARDDHRQQAQQLLEQLVPHSGKSLRIGITGTPGVGKSSLIEALGLRLIEQGHRLAVLAVDPTSPLTSGSILGDKTRMEELARQEQAFIRPSPSGETLGGVAERTREVMLVCEAAGFDVVLVETVGVGQSEFRVASMVDRFLLLLQPGAGDSLQGIKKGVLELADCLVVNKADGDQLHAAKQTRIDHQRALELLGPRESEESTPVLMTSAVEKTGIDELWNCVQDQIRIAQADGRFEARRSQQARAWMWSLVEEGLQRAFRRHPDVAGQIDRMEQAVASSELTPAAAARQLLSQFGVLAAAEKGQD